MTGSASPREVVERYELEFWNEQKFDLVNELLADQIVRHDFGTQRVFTRAQVRERAEKYWASVRSFRNILLRTIADREYVCIVYEAETVNVDGATDVVSSIEVFRVIDSRITEVWNCPRTHARWEGQE